MPDNQLDYAEIRRRVETGLKAQKRNAKLGLLIPNIFMFVVFMALCWGVGLSNPEFQKLIADPKSPLLILLILPTVGWGTGVFMHLMSVLMDFGIGDKQLRDRVMMREVGEEMLRKGLAQEEQAEKPKRDAAALALSDDGELVPVEREEKQVRRASQD